MKTRTKLVEILDHDWLSKKTSAKNQLLPSNSNQSPKCNSLYDKSDQSSGGSSCN